MAVKPRPQSSHVEGGGCKPHRLKSFVQKKSSFILPRRALQSLNNEQWESEAKDVVAYEDCIDATTPLSGGKEKKFQKDYANLTLQPPDGVWRVWECGVGRWVGDCVMCKMWRYILYSCIP